MKNYKMLIAYEGSRYQGWQRQSNTNSTVQGVLEEGLKNLLGQPVETIGAGRTDSGVHASGQVANFKITENLNPEAFKTELNEILPEDIRIRQFKEAGPGFHSRYHAVSKTYIYTIDRRSKPDVFLRRYALHHPGYLDLTRMVKASGHLEGTYDFRSFTPERNKKEDTIRTVYNINFEEQEHLLKIIYRGKGFLYQMVRILTGTLIDVGTGKIGPDDIPAIIKAKNRECAGGTAPARGLCLDQVGYDN